MNQKNIVIYESRQYNPKAAQATLGRFMPGDLVTYNGEKFAAELNGKPGVVHARIEGTKNGYVVDFGSTSLTIDARQLLSFQGKLKADVSEERRRETKYASLSEDGSTANGMIEVRKTRKRKPIDAPSVSPIKQ